MSDPKLTALESKIESHQTDTLKAITDVAKELHGLTVELRHDRAETRELKDEVNALRSDVTDLKINQAVLKDVKSMLGKAAYLAAGGLVTIMVGITIAVIKLT
ncbi:TMhelix containing protein [Vibrio phage 1.210.O._10N.222.52.C2]|nr:TMhelix containing protein [Vibrio phage 1.210.O._10N.222.52.C2]